VWLRDRQSPIRHWLLVVGRWEVEKLASDAPVGESGAGQKKVIAPPCQKAIAS